MIPIMQAAEWIERNLEFPYKSNARFFLNADILQVTFHVPSNSFVDSRGIAKGQMVDVGGHLAVNTIEERFIDETELIRAVFVLVGKFLMHEYCEQFLVEGQQSFDPHGKHDPNHHFEMVMDHTAAANGFQKIPMWAGQYGVKKLF